MSVDFYRTIAHVAISRSDPSYAIPRERGLRLYCTSSARTHGEEATYTLQIRAPMRLANGEEGRAYIIASASLSIEDLDAIGQAIQSARAEVRKAQPANSARESESWDHESPRHRVTGERQNRKTGKAP